MHRHKISRSREPETSILCFSALSSLSIHSCVTYALPRTKLYHCKFNAHLRQAKQLLSAALYLYAHENMLMWSLSCPAPVWQEWQAALRQLQTVLPPVPPSATSHCKHVTDKLHASRWHYVSRLMCLSFLHSMIQARLAVLILDFPSSWPIHTQVWGIFLA